MKFFTNQFSLNMLRMANLCKVHIRRVKCIPEYAEEKASNSRVTSDDILYVVQGSDIFRMSFN